MIQDRGSQNFLLAYYQRTFNNETYRHIFCFVSKRKTCNFEHWLRAKMSYIMLSAILRISKCMWLMLIWFLNFLFSFNSIFIKTAYQQNIGWRTSSGMRTTFWKTMISHASPTNTIPLCSLRHYSIPNPRNKTLLQYEHWSKILLP